MKPSKLPSTSIGRCGARLWMAATLLVCAIVLGSPLPARAQSSLRVELPVQFVFVGDVNGTAFPTGVVVSYVTGWGLGLGIEAYGVAINDPNAGIGGVDTDARYQFVNVLMEVRYNAMHVDLGLGTGSASLESFMVGGQTASADGGSASQIIVNLGWPLGPTWEFHVGYHRVHATSRLTIGGVPSGQIDLGGVMHSAGFKYSF